MYKKTYTMHINQENREDMILIESSDQNLKESIERILSSSDVRRVAVSVEKLVSSTLPRLQAFPGMKLTTYQTNPKFVSSILFPDLVMDADTFCNILNYLWEHKDKGLRKFVYAVHDSSHFGFVLKSKESGKYNYLEVIHSPGVEPNEKETRGFTFEMTALTQEEIESKYNHYYLILDPEDAGSL